MAKDLESKLGKSEPDFEGMLNKSMEEEDQEDKEQDAEFMKGADEKIDAKTKAKLDEWKEEDTATEREIKKGEFSDKDLAIAYGGKDEKPVKVKFAKKEDDVKFARKEDEPKFAKKESK